MFSWFSALLAARRLHLRDKGKMPLFIGDDGELYGRTHRMCSTRLRVGIATNRVAVGYCPRCEYILPRVGQPAPPPQNTKDVDEGDGMRTSAHGTMLKRVK